MNTLLREDADHRLPLLSLLDVDTSVAACNLTKSNPEIGSEPIGICRSPANFDPVGIGTAKDQIQLTIAIDIAGSNRLDRGANGNRGSTPAIGIDEGVASFSVDKSGHLWIAQQLDQLSPVAVPHHQVDVAIAIEICGVPWPSSGGEAEDLEIGKSKTPISSQSSGGKCPEGGQSQADLKPRSGHRFNLGHDNPPDWRAEILPG